MPQKSEAIHQAAKALALARANRSPIPPVSISHGIDSLDAAYLVAEINTRIRLESGRRIVGLKVGLTSKAVQQQLGVNQPDFGVLFDDMEFLSGQDVPTARLLQPKVEAEIAFVLGRDVTGSAPSYSEFLSCLSYALPAIEIVDSAIADWKISLVDTVADNASSGLYVLGDQPMAIGELSLGALGMHMEKNGQPVSTGSGAACLGHPLRAAFWLARTMAERGQGLRQGQVILSGALGPMVPVAAGDLVQASVGKFGGCVNDYCECTRQHCRWLAVAARCANCYVGPCVFGDTLRGRIRSFCTYATSCYCDRTWHPVFIFRWHPSRLYLCRCAGYCISSPKPRCGEWTCSPSVEHRHACGAALRGCSGERQWMAGHGAYVPDSRADLRNVGFRGLSGYSLAQCVKFHSKVIP